MASSQLMQIKICDVVDPRTFWAHEVQKMTRSLVKLRGMESKLQEAMRLLPVRITRTAPVGTMVAVFHQSRYNVNLCKTKTFELDTCTILLNHHHFQIQL